ncbi:MAG: histidinol-phosphate transaminase, partial [Firmicutes bacterium]|nr:histidinol-phosphate transaminase [Bacillota bacterium]
MNNFEAGAFVRADLKELTPYQPDLFPGFIKLDANESPYGLPAEMQAQIYKNIGPETFNRYPDPGA